MDDAGNELDVDIFPEDEPAKEYWDGPGYSGHKTTRLATHGRRYDVDIRIPDRVVFQGIVEFALRTDMRLSTTGTAITTMADVTVVKNPPLEN